MDIPPPNITEGSVDELGIDLRRASRAFSSRGLNDSARWCSELLLWLPKPEISDTGDQSLVDDTEAIPGVSHTKEDEDDFCELALTYLRNHELLRASHVLLSCRTKKALFIRLYAKYLAGERHVLDHTKTTLTRAKAPVNPYLSEILADIEKALPHAKNTDKKASKDDGYLYFLKGLCLLKRPKVTDETPLDKSGLATWDAFAGTSDDPFLYFRLTGLDALVKSTTLLPLNWAAYDTIMGALETPEELARLLPHLPQQVPTLFLYIKACLAFNQVVDGITPCLETLARIFGDMCPAVKSLEAQVFFILNELHDAGAIFEELRHLDPYRLDDLDIYSNVLYMMDRKSDITALAQDLLHIDMARPQVCTVVANYYSLLGNHDMAILYFRRALRLDPSYSSVFTLMGHEYLELRNTNAAIECYRRSVDISPKDYRAWYGLGQMYELQNEPQLATLYYEKAAVLKPTDPRMWSALGACYDAAGRFPDAIHAYRHALENDSVDANIYLRIGYIYRKTGQLDKAHEMFQLALSEASPSSIADDKSSDVNLWLASYQLEQYKRYRSPGGIARAEKFAEAALSTNVKRDEARALLNEILRVKVLHDHSF